MLLGIDIGTTVLKTAVYDMKSGKLRASAAKRLAISIGHDGRREQNPRTIAHSLSTVLRSMASEVGKDWNRIKGVGLASQSGSTLIVDRDTGRPKTPLVLWNDARAFAHFAYIAGSQKAEYWRKFSLRDEPGMGLARIEWLKDQDPGLLAKSNLYVGIGEWIFHLLTGHWRQEACNALQIGCFDARRQTLTEKPLASRGVDLSFFAPMRKGHESFPVVPSAAHQFGFPEGIPVIGPYNDHEAGYMSTTKVSANPLECSLGTAWVGTFRLPSNAHGKSPYQLAIPAPDGKGMLIIQPLLTGNVTWDWALTSFVDSNRKKSLAKQESIFSRNLLSPDGLVALPWINRPNPLSETAHGAGCIIGMNPSTSRQDMMRAVSAGMCYELGRVFEQVKEAKVADSVVLCGGASRGAHFQQMIAALFLPLPTYRVLDEDSMGTRGCLQGFSERVAKVNASLLDVSPALDMEVLCRGKENYRKAFERLYSEVQAGQAYEIHQKR